MLEYFFKMMRELSHPPKTSVTMKPMDSEDKWMLFRFAAIAISIFALIIYKCG